MTTNIVSHIRKYVPLSDDEAQLLLTFLRPVSLKKKEFLLREGQTCTANYFVEKGCLRLYFIGEKGTEHITQFALENWWIADYMSLGSQQPSGFYLQAVEATEAWCVDLSRQDALLKALPQLETYFRLIFQRAFAATQQRMKFQHDFSREEQYLNFNSLFPEFVQRVPQYMLASYLGFTPEYLSEIRKKHSSS